MTYVIFASITKIEERYQRTYIHGTGIGANASFADKSIGWFVSIEGSYESLYLGADPPQLAPGDQVQITIQKVEHAPTVTAPK